MCWALGESEPEEKKEEIQWVSGHSRARSHNHAHTEVLGEIQRMLVEYRQRYRSNSPFTDDDDEIDRDEISPEEEWQSGLNERQQELAELKSAAAELQLAASAFQGRTDLDEALKKQLLNGKRSDDFHAMLVAFYRQNPSQAQEWLSRHPDALEYFTDTEVLMACMNLDQLLELSNSPIPNFRESVVENVGYWAGLEMEVIDLAQALEENGFKKREMDSILPACLVSNSQVDPAKTAAWVLSEASDAVRGEILVDVLEQFREKMPLMSASDSTGAFPVNPYTPLPIDELFVDKLVEQIEELGYEPGEDSPQAQLLLAKREFDESQEADNNGSTEGYTVPDLPNQAPKKSVLRDSLPDASGASLDYQMLLAEGELTLTALQAQLLEKNPSSSKEEITTFLLEEYFGTVPEQGLDLASQLSSEQVAKLGHLSFPSNQSVRRAIEVSGYRYLLNPEQVNRTSFGYWLELSPEAAESAVRSLPMGHPDREELKSQ